MLGVPTPTCAVTFTGLKQVNVVPVVQFALNTSAPPCTASTVTVAVAVAPDPLRVPVYVVVSEVPCGITVTAPLGVPTPESDFTVITTLLVPPTTAFDATAVTCAASGPTVNPAVTLVFAPYVPSPEYAAVAL